MNCGEQGKQRNKAAPSPGNINSWVAAVPLAAWCFVIFVLSSVPGNKYPQVQWEHADKLVHICIYFWVGVFGWIFFKSRGAGVFSAFAFGVLYGLSDEIHQLWVPRRTFSMTDWIADSVGVVVGIILIFTLHRRRTSTDKFHRKNKSSSPERMEAS